MTGTAATIGVFDGVHRGHQALITSTVQRAREHGLDALVVTFDPNPLEVLRPDHAPTRLTGIDRRVELIRQCGVDAVEVLAFTPDLAAMSAHDFVTEILGRLDVREVVIGQGFRFGNRALGTAATLREAGLTVDEYSLVGGDLPLSSTRVRAAIAEGAVDVAAQMLGRPPEVEGVVVAGQQRGRDLGYPTANVEHHRLAAVPADGVYAGHTHIDGVAHAAAISVGTNPTFDGQTRTVESYLLDVEADLYGREVRVEFVRRLRPMAAFDSISALLRQMDDDVRRTREVLGS
jgi:riboflavin kinase/FMN adenylyltransferase